MKAIIAIATLLILGAVHSATDDTQVFKAFQDFMKTYEKTYNSPNEFIVKYEVFKKNYHMINDQNRLAFKKSRTFTMKINQFADLTPEEFERTYLNLNVKELEALRSESETMTSTVEDIPESLDWRDVPGAVTEVKNQGSCGSCWAFSAIANIEGQYGLQTKKTQTFSEQHLVDCDTVDQACNGGLMDTAFDYLKTTGVVSDAEYKYEGKKKECRLAGKKVLAKVTGYKFASKDEEEIRRVVAEKGPLAVALNATPLQFYFGGIFDPWVCSDNINHAVTMVGYGVDAKKGKKYWLIKNSWGKTWGEKGYLRLIAGKNKCGINTYVLSADVETI